MTDPVAAWLAGLTLMAFSGLLAFLNSARQGHVALVDVSVLAMGLVHGLALPLVLAGAQRDDIPGAEFLRAAGPAVLLHPLVVASAMLALVAGWHLARGGAQGELPARAGTTLRLQVALAGMLLLALVTQNLYTRDFGGFRAFLDIHRQIRAGRFDLTGQSSYSFLRPFGGFALLACYGYWGLLLSWRRLSGLHRALALTGLALAAPMSAYVLYASGGRLQAVSFVTVLLLALCAPLRRDPRIWLPGAPLLMLTGLFVLFGMSAALGIKAMDTPAAYLAHELSFPLVTALAQAQQTGELWLFQDLILAPLNLLPSSLTQGWVIPASERNTILIAGAAKGVAGVTGTVPVDLIGFGMMQLHLPGVLITGLIFGGLLARLSRLPRHLSGGMAEVAEAYLVVKVAAITVFYADPAHIVSSHFAPLALLLLLAGVACFRRGLRSLSGWRFMSPVAPP